MRGHFACVCVELDLEQRLTERVWVGEEDEENFFQIVSYENIPTLCKSCGCLGHSAHNYMNLAIKSDQNLGGAQENTSTDVAFGSTPAKDNMPLPQVTQVELLEVGPYIRVQRRKGRRTPARQPIGVSHKSSMMENDSPLGCTSNQRPGPNNPSKEKTPIACLPPQQKAQSDPLQTSTMRRAHVALQQ